MRDAARQHPALGRLGLMWAALVEALPEADPTVLDCGGGSGTFAVPLAQSGASVTVVDVSADALATLQRRAAEAGVADRVAARQADVENLADAIDGDRFHLVLAHGVLGAVEDVGAAFAAMVSAVRPGGSLSVLVANPVATVLARAFAGDIVAALAELRGLDTSMTTVGPESVLALCRENGLVVTLTQGIGVFSELLPGRALDAPGAHEVLDQLEAAAAGRPPLRDIAGRVHLMARRPG